MARRPVSKYCHTSYSEDSQEIVDYNLEELYCEHVETRAPFVTSSLLDRGSGYRLDPTDHNRTQGNPRKNGSRGMSRTASVEDVDVGVKTPVTSTARERPVCNNALHEIFA